MPPLPTAKTTLESEIIDAQDAHFVVTGKYKQYKRDEYAPDIEIDEYVGPFGNGFLLYEYFTVNQDMYCRRTNYGPEARFTHDWILIKK